jgi:hypothetical protein
MTQSVDCTCTKILMGSSLGRFRDAIQLSAIPHNYEKRCNMMRTIRCFVMSHC